MFFFSVLLTLSACSENENLVSTESGLHFQGRDCLSCHNVDLAKDKHLVVGGTLFKSAVVNDADAIENSCNTQMDIEFLDNAFNVVYSSADYYDEDSRGNQGRGNIFLLDRLFNSSLNGSYTVRIVDRETGLNMSQSASASHSFSGGEYQLSAQEDNANRLSCNSCHNGEVTAPLYAKFNQDLCK